jgi:hypothetical protein
MSSSKQTGKLLSKIFAREPMVRLSGPGLIARAGTREDGALFAGGRYRLGAPAGWSMEADLGSSCHTTSK